MLIYKVRVVGNALSDNHLYGHRAFGHTVIKYMTKQGKQYKELCKLSAGHNVDPIEGPIKAEIDVYFGDHRKRDVQGCLKAICDGFNGVLYIDDSQIVELVARKHYCKELPRAEISISKIQETTT